MAARGWAVGGAMALAMLCMVALAAVAISATAQADGAAAPVDREVVVQVSTLGALMQGVFDGDMAYAELAERGDTGIGTLNGLDGEVIGIDGAFFQMASDGTMRPVPPEAKAPFGMFTWLDSDEILTIQREIDMSGLLARIDAARPSANVFYAIRVDGHFASIRTRSVPKQAKPYPRLTEVTAHQPTFEYADVEGTLVGFWCPAYMAGLNMPGYHFHFATAARDGGGHVLGFTVRDAVVRIDVTPAVRLDMPVGGGFMGANLEPAREAEMHQAER
jgi:acetolactate decarboxylase